MHWPPVVLASAGCTHLGDHAAPALRDHLARAIDDATHACSADLDVIRPPAITVDGELARRVAEIIPSARDYKTSPTLLERGHISGTLIYGQIEHVLGPVSDSMVGREPLRRLASRCLS